MTTIPDTPLVPKPYPNFHTVGRWAQAFLPSWGQSAWWNGRQMIQRASGQPHESDFEALRCLDLPANVRVLDLGANRGQSIDSIYAVLGRDVRIQITAVEPSHRLATRLRYRYPSVDVRNVAVGNAQGSFDLYTPSYRGFRYDGLASCDEFLATDWFRYSVWRYNPDLVTTERERIHLTKVDDLRLDVNFVKIDVQGMELAALRGMEITLTRQRPIVMIETPDQEIFDFFDGLGYTARYWVSGALSPVRPVWPLNVFFLP